MSILVYSTFSGGHVIVRTDVNGNIDGWRVPGASDWLTRDLHIVENARESYYRRTPEDEAKALLLAEALHDWFTGPGADPAKHADPTRCDTCGERAEGAMAEVVREGRHVVVHADTCMAAEEEIA